MKYFLTIVYILLAVFNSNAQCVFGSRLSFFPTEVIDNPNPIIVIEGHPATLKFINLFLKNRKGDKIELKLVSENRLWQKSQFVFKPIKPLKNKTTYYAGWETKMKNNTPEITDRIIKQAKNTTWQTDFKTNQEEDKKLPKLSFSHPYFNCSSEGIESYAIFNLDYENKFWKWIEVSVIDSNSLESKNFLLHENAFNKGSDAQITIGASGCGGQILFLRDTQYSLKLNFLNSEGIIYCSTKWINIVNPSDGNIFKAKFIEKSTGSGIEGLNIQMVNGNFCRNESQRNTFVTDSKGNIEIQYRIPILEFQVFNFFEPRSYYLIPNTENEIFISQKILIPNVKEKKNKG